MVEWQRKRRPEEVPAPVAIALSDYCRRAETPSEAELVREALALLTTSDDARVRSMCEAEPPARPLGPFAVIDLLMGTPATLAAERQRTGYYELVRQLVSSRNVPEPAPSAPPLSARATPRPPLPIPRVSAPLPPVAEPYEAPVAGKKKKRSKAPTVEDRIAPKKRKAGEKAAAPPPREEKPSNYRKRNLPLPRGRYTTVSAVKQKTETLKDARQKPFLEGLLEQSETRHSVWKALSAHYATKGRPITLVEVEGVLEHHGLMERLSSKEREQILSQVAEARGGLERAARNLGLKGKAELLVLAKAVGAKKQVEDLRERFVREALAPSNLPQRLDMAHKIKYLADLGISRQFDTALTRDLKELFEKSPNADVFEVSRRTGFNAEMLERAATRLGLLQPER